MNSCDRNSNDSRRLRNITKCRKPYAELASCQIRCYDADHKAALGCKPGPNAESIGFDQRSSKSREAIGVESTECGSQSLKMYKLDGPLNKVPMQEPWEKGICSPSSIVH
jgi:hypothetical protein